MFYEVMQPKTKMQTNFIFWSWISADAADEATEDNDAIGKATEQGKSQFPFGKVL